MTVLRYTALGRSQRNLYQYGASLARPVPVTARYGSLGVA